MPAQRVLSKSSLDPISRWILIAVMGITALPFVAALVFTLAFEAPKTQRAFPTATPAVVASNNIAVTASR